jgi:4-azaleucine resistance transporter AzlC
MATVRKAFRAAFPLTLPVMAGYLVLGFGFGLLLESKGYGISWALIMSVSIYAGAMQYMAVDLLAGGASLISCALMTLLINARHLFYGLSLLDKYKGMGWKKPALIFQLTDETYSLVCVTEPPPGVDKGWFYLTISSLNHLYWIVGGMAGAAAGSLFGLNTAGVSFSMTALFVVIFTDQWLKNRNKLPAAVGVGVTLVCLLVFGPDRFIIPAMAGIALALVALKNKIPAGEAAP